MKKPATILPIILLVLPTIGFAQSKPLEMKWGELAPMLTGHSVTVTLTDGSAVKGEAVSIREDSMLLDVSTAVKGFARGSGSIPRNSIILIDVQRTKGSWGKILGTLIGALGGMSLGIYVDAKEIFRASTGETVSTFVGISSAGAVGGYFAGRVIDKRVTHIRLVP